MSMQKDNRPWAVLNYAGMATRAIEQEKARKAERPTLADMKSQARREGLQGASVGALRRIHLGDVMAEKVKAELDATRTDGNPVDYIIDDEGHRYDRNEYAAEKGSSRADGALVTMGIDKMYRTMHRGALIDAMADMAEEQEAQEDRAAVKIDAAKQRREKRAAKRKGK